MTLIRTTRIINETEFSYAYSDAGYYIEQTDTGNLYEEAYDPIGHTHTYVETDEPIDDGTEPEPEDEEAIYAEAGRILLGVEE